MDPAEIRYIQKAFIKERGAEILEKSPSPKGVGNSEKNFQHRNEIHHAVGLNWVSPSSWQSRQLCAVGNLFPNNQQPYEMMEL